MVILCGYGNSIYENAFMNWTRVDRETFADGAKKRTESLWLNPACTDAQSQTAFDLASSGTVRET